MSKRTKQKPRPGPAAVPARKKAPARLAGPMAVAALAALAALGLWLSCSKPPAPSQQEPHSAPTNAPPGSPSATASLPDPALQKLVGRWLRPDGGYTLEIRGVDAGGKMDAGYFNPQPIHVARAQAWRDAATTKLFVELRDVGYPGSSYTLLFDPAADQLKGIYFQAAAGEQYEIFFERLK